MSVFTMTGSVCVALSLLTQGIVLDSQHDHRVPFLQGMRSIYQEACEHLVRQGDEESVSECIDEAVSTILQHDGAQAYKSCEDLGGMLASRIKACAGATTNIAALGERTSPEELLTILGDAQRFCTPTVLCEGEAPQAVGTLQNPNGTIAD